MCVYDVCHLCLEYLEKERQPCQCPPPFFSSLHLSSPLHLFFFPSLFSPFPWFFTPVVSYSLWSTPHLSFLLFAHLLHSFMLSSSLLSLLLSPPFLHSSLPYVPFYSFLSSPPPLPLASSLFLSLYFLSTPLSDMQYNEVTKYSSVQRLLPVPIVELTEGWFHLYVVLSNSPIFHRQIPQGS